MDRMVFFARIWRIHIFVTEILVDVKATFCSEGEIYLKF